MYHAPGLFIELGNVETSILSSKIKNISIDKPVFIAGLARSGSTLLLEIAAACNGVATHRNRDFPLVHIPYIWNKLVDMTPRRANAPKERPHGDRMLVTDESPEAMEEPIWTSFFAHLHDPKVDNILGRAVSNQHFEAFYKEHIRKLLLARNGVRYASKGNYNLARLGYLARIFPEARFIIPVRAPVAHIGSLLRQHQRFTQIHRADPRSLAAMRQGGHFEFGVDLRPINFGHDGSIHEKMLSQERSTSIEGWALYWREAHRHIHTLLESDPDIKARAMIVRFETLCQAPAETIGQILLFAGLGDESVIQAFAPKVSAPDYYDPGFTSQEVGLIEQATADIRPMFGY